MDVALLLESTGLSPEGAVPWGETVPAPDSGVYLVSLHQDPRDGSGLATAPISTAAVRALLEARPECCVDGKRATVESLTGRLSQIWIPDQSVLYIGRATSLTSRVNQYYSTPLGARSPHAGGWPLKTLEPLKDLWVHWASTPDFRAIEGRLLNAFVAAVPSSVAHGLVDPANPLPFANLVGGDHRRKRHGITGARAPGSRSRTLRERTTRSLGPSSRSSGNEGWTQPVTGPDLAAGRIRVPKASKHLFPGERTHLDVRLRGLEKTSRYDPRLGPPERSGVLGIGRSDLAGRVNEGERLRISNSDGQVILE